MKKSEKETPLMKQYYAIKAEYPGALLLFRVGDFYETFGEDAITASRILGIVLTKRSNGAASEMELAGFPHHSLDTYLPKLVRAGQRVAICDQLEDPKLTKTIVKRGVTELVTPGVSYNDKVLDSRSSNFLCGLALGGPEDGCAFLDISTGEFMVAQGNAEYIRKLVQGFRPAEILVARPMMQKFTEQYGDQHCTHALEDWAMQTQYGEEKLTRHFGTQNLKGFGIQDMPMAITAAGACLHYLEQTQHHHVSHITGISRIDRDKFVWLDHFTIRNLEILAPSNPGGKCLADILDETLTPMGSRMLKKWLVLPLKEIIPIRERQDVVEFFVQQQQIRSEVSEALRETGDLERLVSKIALGRVNPREVLQLARSLRNSARIRGLLLHSSCSAAAAMAEQINPCESVTDRIFRHIREDAPALVNKGHVFAEGMNPELDELRKMLFSGKEYLLEIQQREMAATGISSLKISYNSVFGYYLEVTHAHKDKVPAEWIRKQTLTNAERYITPELKDYEEKILNAEERMLALESRMWDEFIQGLSEWVVPAQLNAQIVARIDCLQGFAKLAADNRYCRPVVDDSLVIDLKDARHPVIEKQLPPGEDYIPNDTLLDSDEQRMIILTGPNMSGKSAVLRQTALNVLMAQIGSFVPASAARIGLVDKIYTRVGASDNISLGESTFMVEMIETASILNNLSERSLVILDEIGRGTSTFDGVSLAWAIAEFLNRHPTRPKTLFATHYHELNELESKCEGTVNYHISIRESGHQVIFLRKLARGGSEHSFGIHVARMAGIPRPVVERASDILRQLEQDRASITGRETLKQVQGIMQLSMFNAPDPVLMEIKDKLLHLDVNTLSPVEALLKLNEIKNMIR